MGLMRGPTGNKARAFKARRFRTVAQCRKPRRPNMAERSAMPGAYCTHYASAAVACSLFTV